MGCDINPFSDLPHTFQEYVKNWHPDDLRRSIGMFMWMLLPVDSRVQGYMVVNGTVVASYYQCKITSRW